MTLSTGTPEVLGTAEPTPVPAPRPPADSPQARSTTPSEPESLAWALVRQAQRGDMGAFARLYRMYLDTVFRFIYFRVGNRQVAEDLTSVVFERALKRIGALKWQGRDPGAWFITIARNLVADYFKSAYFRLEVATGDVLDSDDDIERCPVPEAVVLQGITHVVLLAAVKRLSSEQQECIVLRFLRGLSVSETARIMGKNEGAIKALQYRATNTLRRLLAKDVALFVA